MPRAKVATPEQDRAALAVITGLTHNIIDPAISANEYQRKMVPGLDAETRLRLRIERDLLTRMRGVLERERERIEVRDAAR